MILFTQMNGKYVHILQQTANSHSTVECGVPINTKFVKNKEKFKKEIQ
jgi:hypothetical protein